MKTLSVNIPFCGFYESILSSEMDYTLEREIEYRIELDREEGIPAHERLEESDYYDIYERHIDYKAWEKHLAKEWVASFSIYFSEIVGEKIEFEFEEMTSPREYNFQTDRVFASIPLKAAARLYAKAKRNLFVDLSKCIKERFTPCSGFIPYYSNNLDKWLEKPLREWDHNELGTLVMSFLQEENDSSFSIFEGMSENGDFDEGLYHAVKWNDFDGDVAIARIEKLAAILEEEPDFVPPVPRCPLTLDMGF